MVKNVGYVVFFEAIVDCWKNNTIRFLDVQFSAVLGCLLTNVDCSCCCNAENRLKERRSIWTKNADSSQPLSSQIIRQSSRSVGCLLISPSQCFVIGRFVVNSDCLLAQKTVNANHCGELRRTLSHRAGDSNAYFGLYAGCSGKEEGRAQLMDVRELLVTGAIERRDELCRHILKPLRSR